MFKALCEQERKHAALVQHLIDFVSSPQTWLEDAEFYHLDEY